jgi:arsenical pump membrane protein
MQFTPHIATWTVSALAVFGVIVRPMGWPEWIFAVAGAGLLVLTGLLGYGDAVQGILSGTDVYLFLAGMMLLAETARREGLFDYLAAFAARSAKGSPYRLFGLVYVMGTIVTIFLSNDATAVVLTPAVIAVARAAKVSSPIPYLLICAFVANAASFVLPISNPANLASSDSDSFRLTRSCVRRFKALSYGSR